MTYNENYKFCIDNYPYILAWGQHMGSHGHYIKEQVKLAIEDKAPKDAIYKRDDGTWATLADPITKSELDAYLNGTRRNNYKLELTMPTINITVTDQRREDMIVGALEGGSNYWYLIGDKASELLLQYGKEPLSIRFWKAIKDGKSIEIHDIETGQKLGEINLKSIEEGEQLMADKYPSHLLDIVNENDDANTADIWFQLCVLKEVVYG